MPTARNNPFGLYSWSEFGQDVFSVLSAPFVASYDYVLKPFYDFVIEPIGAAIYNTAMLIGNTAVDMWNGITNYGGYQEDSTVASRPGSQNLPATANEQKEREKRKKQDTVVQEQPVAVTAEVSNPGFTGADISRDVQVEVGDLPRPAKYPQYTKPDDLLNADVVRSFVDANNIRFDQLRYEFRRDVRGYWNSR